MKPLKAFAIVKKKNPKIIVSDIYVDKDVHVEKDEKIVSVTITHNEKVKSSKDKRQG